jgi:hypothetical protein
MGMRVLLQRRRLLVLLVTLGVMALAALPVAAISYGQPDGEGHPTVGSLLFDFDGDGTLDQMCTGTMVSPTVMVTASHCTFFFDEIGLGSNEAPVTFDPVIGTSPTVHYGTHHTNPLFGGKGGASDTGDVAVIVFDSSPIPGIGSAQLPTARLLDDLAASHELNSTPFTAVGYGTERDVKTKAWQSLSPGGERRFVDQEVLSLTKAWITLSMNLATGNGGTCYGDSGGPHFLGAGASETNVVVSVTVTGDRWCKATDKTYRLDTPPARAFLDTYLDLP